LQFAVDASRPLEGVTFGRVVTIDFTGITRTADTFYDAPPLCAQSAQRLVGLINVIRAVLISFLPR
jgi:hypothetical protein